jgi:hypothetical protein
MGTTNSADSGSKYFDCPKNFQLNKSSNALLIKVCSSVEVLFKYRISRSGLPEIKLYRNDSHEALSHFPVVFQSTLLEKDIVNSYDTFIKIKPQTAIGVIVDFSRNCYFKLYRNKYFPYNLGIIIGTWTYTGNLKNCKQLLSDDLELGYQIYLVTHNLEVFLLTKDTCVEYENYGCANVQTEEDDLCFDLR